VGLRAVTLSYPLKTSLEKENCLGVSYAPLGQVSKLL
jgi:hypothetical protein